MVRTLTGIALLFGCILASGASFQTALPDREEIAVHVDGREVKTYGLVTLEDGRLWGPLTPIALTMGAEQVTVDEETGEILVLCRDRTLRAKAGEEVLEAEGRCFYAPGGVRIRSGDAVVPLTALADFFCAYLGYDEELRLVDLTLSGKEMESGEDFYDREELYWLSRIVEAEARGEPLEGKIAVANVVLTRTVDPNFPSTVKEVIFDTVGGVQFSPAYSGSIENDPGEESVLAAKLALDGEYVVRALYFSMTKFADTCWASRHCERVATLGGHVFFA